MKHNLLSVLIMTALFSMTSTAWAQFSGSGAGTAANPFIITTAQHLDQVRNNLGAYYRLGNDIDLATYMAIASGTSSATAGWKPIGDNSLGAPSRFKGVFDGNGYTISGLFINRPLTYYMGLFGVIAKEALIQNVGITINSKKVIGYIYVGGLVGNNYGFIENCSVYGAVTGDNGVGGLVGLNSNSGDESIKNCYATGAVTGTRGGLGGLVGLNNGGIKNCYSTGAIVGTGTNVGGFVGENNSSGSITACFFNSDETNLPSIGVNKGKGKATGLTSGGMKSSSSYVDAGWNFNRIWSIKESVSYPFLRPQTTVTLTFNAQGGSAIASISTKAGVPIATPLTSPTRSGYVFSGWYTGATSGTKVSFPLTITSNTTIYAWWTSTTVLHNVTLPAVTGLATTPAAGIRTAANGGNFVFEMWALAGYSLDHFTISTNRGNTIVTEFLNSTPGQERLRVTIKNITAATTIIISTLHDVTLPAVTGLATSPAAGIHTVTNGGDFVFEMWVLAGYNLGNPTISTNRGNAITYSTIPGEERLRITINNITAATTITIAGIVPTILHNVTLPAVTGVATSPAAGIRTAGNGENFVFEIWALAGYSLNHLAISTNRGNAIETAYINSTPGEERLRVTIKNIISATTITIAGIVPVGNEPSPYATRVWGYGGKVYFSLAAPAEVSIYTVSGMLYDQCSLPAGDTSLSLPAGLYIIRIPGRADMKIIIH